MPKLDKSTSDFKKIISKLGDLCPQAAYAIVTKHFLAEWVHILRVVYPSLSTPYARRMDAVIADGLVQMSHTPLPAVCSRSSRLSTLGHSGLVSFGFASRSRCNGRCTQPGDEGGGCV